MPKGRGALPALSNLLPFPARAYPRANKVPGQLSIYQKRGSCSARGALALDLPRRGAGDWHVPSGRGTSRINVLRNCCSHSATYLGTLRKVLLSSVVLIRIRDAHVHSPRAYGSSNSRRSTPALAVSLAATALRGLELSSTLLVALPQTQRQIQLYKVKGLAENGVENASPPLITTSLIRPNSITTIVPTASSNIGSCAVFDSFPVECSIASFPNLVHSSAV